MFDWLSNYIHPIGAITLQVLYLLLIAIICIRVIIDTRSVSKTLAYLLLIIFLPILGAVFYFSFGINYRKRKIYNKKLKISEALKERFTLQMKALENLLLDTPKPELVQFNQTYKLLNNQLLGGNWCLPNQYLRLLNNGEEKFPALLEELKKAKHHIHIEYYIVEDDEIGNQLKSILIEKVKEGVSVRFIYDDFGSSSIRKGYVKELRSYGVLAYPFHKIRLMYLANRLNYRNHRKIVVIDGTTGFVGGINIADRYINNNTIDTYWRDMHLMIKGYSSSALQQIFLNDWNFCSGEALEMTDVFFPLYKEPIALTNFTQIISSGPDTDQPNILYAVVNAINAAKHQILITTPYYIPDVTLQNALILAALSGKEVKLLVPKDGDSKLVGIASRSFFDDLLMAGVKIYQYQKGFIHSKTFIIDNTLACIGTANMDTRSFDLNFEVNAMIYDKEIAMQMSRIFENDLQDSLRLEPKRWIVRPKLQKAIEKIIRLTSPFM
jgi:cardiolipin synthase